MNLFSDNARRNPYPLYERIRSTLPVFREPQSGLWMILDYDGVKQALQDHETFSSKYGPDWLVFSDPPRHSKLRALVSRAFTPKSIANLEPRIKALSRELLDPLIERGRMDLAGDYAVPLPMMVISEMLGIPTSDRTHFKRWVDVILRMSYTIGRQGDEGMTAMDDFSEVTAEMNEYLGDLLAERRKAPTDDLLTRLSQAEMDGERLTQSEILGFFQLLLLAGSETTTNLINNAILSFIENPDQLARLRQNMELLPRAIEEVLRYRAPLQWIYRVTKREVEMQREVIPAQTLVLAVIGSANHDPKYFAEPSKFDISRDPNPHIGFGSGMHFCLGAALARLESRIALTDLLGRLSNIRLSGDQPWEPRKGLHVHGPTSLPICFDPV